MARAAVIQRLKPLEVNAKAWLFEGTHGYRFSASRPATHPACRGYQFTPGLTAGCCIKDRGQHVVHRRVAL
jgi:hypothetical protein